MSEKKKVGIITFQHANNYGALLQSYALQASVKKLGFDCDVIAYQSEYIEKPYSLIQLKRKGIVKYIIGTLGYICYLPRKKACGEFRKLISYSSKVNKDTISAVNSAYDLFIAGSDQVWNYKLTGGDKNFLLDFVTDGRKKNSYAASIGIHDIEDNYREAYKAALKTFRNISVREKRAQEILWEIGEIESCVVTDPTLLLTKKEWESLITEEKLDGCIAVYQLGISKRFTSYVQELARKTGEQVKYIPFPLGGNVRCRRMLKAGPFEWLSIFHSADYVVTDSFHGVVFSLLFHKQFVVEVNERNKDVGGRIYELLAKVGLENRIMNQPNCTAIDTPIDFAKVKAVLETERKTSIEYLRFLLDDCI